MLQKLSEPELSTGVDDSLAFAHAQVDTWLAQAAEDARQRPSGSLQLDKRALKKAFGPEQFRALLSALIVQAGACPTSVSTCVGDRTEGYHIARIMTDMLRAAPTLPDSSLAELITFSVESDGWWPCEEICDHIERAFRQRALDAGLWHGIAAVHEAMKGDNSVTGQAIRRRLAILRWHDPYDEINLERCWSEVIRADIRRIKGDARRRWTELFAAIPVTDNSEPASAWVRAAPGLVAAVGEDALRGRLLAWLEPFAGPGPVRLTMVGSHVAKALLWYCRLVRSEPLDHATLALLDTNWRSREFVFRPLTVLAGNATLLPPDRAQQVVKKIRDQLGAKAGARFDKAFAAVVG